MQTVQLFLSISACPCSYDLLFAVDRTLLPSAPMKRQSTALSVVRPCVCVCPRNNWKTVDQKFM